MNSYNGFPGALRSAAQRWLNEQWKAGLRPRPAKCDACAQTQGEIDAHAEDYSKPFGDHTDQYKLCYTCHLVLHCRVRRPIAWDRYKIAIRAGVQFAPAHERNFPQVLRLMRALEEARPTAKSMKEALLGLKAVNFADGRRRTVLDTIPNVPSNIPTPR